jgi:hypothetical protein
LASLGSLGSSAQKDSRGLFLSRTGVQTGPTTGGAGLRATSACKGSDMEFRLVYEGPLKANGRVAHKHEIRKVLHPQLKELWEHPPLVNVRYFLGKKGTTEGSLLKSPELVTEVGAFSFASLVDSSLGVVAEL